MQGRPPWTRSLAQNARPGDAVGDPVAATHPEDLAATDSAGFGAIIIVVIEVAGAVGDPYDLNRNGTIEKEEVLWAIGDYFAGLIEKEEVLALVSRYFGR